MCILENHQQRIFRALKPRLVKQALRAFTASTQAMLVRAPDSVRQFLHRHVGQTIESRFPEVAESRPELITQRSTAAAMPDQAIPYWMKAGERALARSAYREPLAYFDRALTLARSLPESPARARQILDLLFLLGETHSRNHNLSEALQTFKEAFELARAVELARRPRAGGRGCDRSRNLCGARASNRVR